MAVRSKDSGLELHSVLEAIVQSVRDAKKAADLDAAGVTADYRTDKRLSGLKPPAFFIEHVDIELRFAIVGTVITSKGKRPPQIRVTVEADKLKHLSAEVVHVLRFRVADSYRKHTPPDEK